LEQERARKRELPESEERLHALNDATFEGINLTLAGVIIEANNQLRTCWAGAFPNSSAASSGLRSS